ncbi:hypothetical protein MANES_01G019500v8 [Manihot esculenta]|uniref:Uncharacterized protein n=1 Tax=Manihot esculenta TaxID=3983 RepID=A0A2C9WH04_MANES|nr:hypothetical protein MANES_01G019500v8 [Manihot esculenta]
MKVMGFTFRWPTCNFQDLAPQATTTKPVTGLSKEVDIWEKQQPTCLETQATKKKTEDKDPSQLSTNLPFHPKQKQRKKNKEKMKNQNNHPRVGLTHSLGRRKKGYLKTFEDTDTQAKKKIETGVGL